MAYKIKTGTPPDRPEGRMIDKWPFNELGVNQYFDVPEEESTQVQVYMGIWNRVNGPKKLISRRNADGSRRIWRVA